MGTLFLNRTVMTTTVSDATGSIALISVPEASATQVDDVVQLLSDEGDRPSGSGARTRRE